MLQSDHIAFQPSLDQRQRARAWLKDLGTPNAQFILGRERPVHADGESEEPVEAP